MTFVFAATALSVILVQPAFAGHNAQPDWQYGSMAGADLGDNANLNGAVPFPADNDWNTDISKSDVDPNSDNLIASIGLSTGLHPDFGSGTYAGAIIGIPYVVVSDDQAYVKIKLKA